ncbi:undecaprenyldiphospho-muramoylpentapeptide beta-N-acetylglucosaminyltransferase [Persephonella sp.]
MSKKVFIAGGGTGGHFYPAVAVAEALKEKGYKIIYFGAERGIEGKKDISFGEKILFDIKGVRGKSLPAKIPSSIELLKTAFLIKKIIKKEKPEFSIAFGGYASFPLGIASILTGTKLYIHEQNSIPSYTNKLLSNFAKKIFITFEFSKKYFPENKTVLTGFPIRKQLKEDFNLSREEARSILGIEKDKKTVLIFGGSQGAKKLTEIGLSLSKKLKGIQFIIIGGKHYKNIPDTDNIKFFRYYERMGVLYKATDIIVSRAGAGTVSEILFYGKPTVFVPYPYAASNHQYYNVKWLEEKELAFVIPDRNLTEKILLEKLDKLFSLNLKQIEEKIRKYSIMDTIEKILKEINNGKV